MRGINNINNINNDYCTDGYLSTTTRVPPVATTSGPHALARPLGEGGVIINNNNNKYTRDIYDNERNPERQQVKPISVRKIIAMVVTTTICTMTMVCS